MFTIERWIQLQCPNNLVMSQVKLPEQMVLVMNQPQRAVPCGETQGEWHSKHCGIFSLTLFLRPLLPDYCVLFSDTLTLSRKIKKIAEFADSGSGTKYLNTKSNPSGRNCLVFTGICLRVRICSILYSSNDIFLVFTRLSWHDWITKTLCKNGGPRFMDQSPEWPIGCSQDLVYPTLARAFECAVCRFWHTCTLLCVCIDFIEFHNEISFQKSTMMCFAVKYLAAHSCGPRPGSFCQSSMWHLLLLAALAADTPRRTESSRNIWNSCRF